MMRLRQKLTILSSIAVVVALLALARGVLLQWRDSPQQAPGTEGTDTTAELRRINAESELGEASGGSVQTPEVQFRRRFAPQATEEAHLSDPVIATEEGIGETLRLAVETSIFGNLDPRSALEAAMLVADRDPVTSAVPKPNPDGSLRFPILGLPDGMQAEFVVRSSNNPKFGEVLALEIRLDAPEGPYIIDGAARKAPELMTQVWLDNEGAPLHYSMFTSLELDARSTRNLLGSDWTHEDYCFGVNYQIDMRDPTGSTCKSYGLRQGKPAYWDTQSVTIEGGPWRDTQGITDFGSRLHEMYASILSQNQRN